MGGRSTGRRAREPTLPYLAVPHVLVDSNVLIDIFERDPEWSEWSFRQLAPLLEAGQALINPLVYAEIAVPFARIEDLEQTLAPFPLVREPLPWDAAFMAAQAHKVYRRRGGTKRSPLPDFYIGAHATVGGYALLTRDPARYREYFPRLRIVAPD
jgi:predicted nucleic acid-binding protein